MILMLQDKLIRRKTVMNCLKAIMQLDPDTDITEHFIRSLCQAGKVDHFITGKAKILVNYDDLLFVLNSNQIRRENN